MNIKFIKFIETLKELRSKHLITTKVMYFLEKTSLAVMIISATILICVLINPEFWNIKLSSYIVHLQESDNEDLSVTVVDTLNEVNKTLISIREDGVKLDVSPSLRQVVNATASALTVSAGVYTGTKLADMTPTLAGKTAVVAGTVLATVATKTIIEEVGKNDIFTSPGGLVPRGEFLPPGTSKINPSSEDPRLPESPGSPQNNDWTVNSPNESSTLDLSSLLSNLDSTESLQKIMESLLMLSSVSFSMTLFVLITVVLNLKDFTKVKWLNNKPKVLNFINRVKATRTSVIIPILLLLLFISLVSSYGSYSVLKALLIYKSSGL